MTQLYANENFPLKVVQALRRLGHDVLTTQEAGKANLAIPDIEVLGFARFPANFYGSIGRSDNHQLLNVCARP